MKNIVYIGNNFSKKSKYNSTLSTLSEMLICEGFIVHVYSDKKNKFLRILDMCLGILKHRKSLDYILIDTFSTFNFYYAFIISQLARMFSLKYIPILHGGNLPFRLDTSPYISRMIFNHSFKNVSPSRYLAHEFLKRNFKTMFIPNAIPIKEYDFYERKKVNPKILWVRAFDKTYNPLLAIKLLNILKKKYSKVELCMVGPAKDETINEVKLLINQNNLSENCIITGVLEKEEWHKLSKSYDVFINTTNIDNMPVSIIEAMALGIPIVSTNVGGIPYLISNNKTGITVPINDEQKMATEIIKLIENPNEANRISKNARSFVEQFDLEIIKNDWIHLLK